jgi:AmmeMemoRadiSam system protein A
MDMLSEPESHALLAVARDGLEAAVTGRPRTPIAGEDAGALARDAACFVTLYERGQLRGCIGTLEPIASLAESTREMAKGAALRDPRFRPVTPDELPEIHLSVSVLSEPRPLSSPDDFQLGRDGLIVSRGQRRGVLLPQVAAERGWDFYTFVAQTCVKAGLPSDAWKDPDTKIEIFSGTVYK